MSMVLLARTYADARVAQERYAGQIPGLADARLASTFAYRVLDGSRTERVYVAPGTRETSRWEDYRRAVLVLARNLAHTSGSHPAVLQISRDGMTSSLDLQDLETEGRLA